VLLLLLLLLLRLTHLELRLVACCMLADEVLDVRQATAQHAAAAAAAAAAGSVRISADGLRN
jgi:hypothetical protein